MTPRRPRNPNQLAKSIIDIATGQAPDVPADDKDPAAVQRGRLGGLKGGRPEPIMTQCPYSAGGPPSLNSKSLKTSMGKSVVG